MLLRRLLRPIVVVRWRKTVENVDRVMRFMRTKQPFGVARGGPMLPS